MIFVTVGTHEQQFNRLVECVDLWAKNKDEKVVIQIGFCSYTPKHCVWKKLFTYEDMKKYYEEARIIVSHGGPSSFISPLQLGKTPIVFPRKKEFNEHVNDHQVFFCRNVYERFGSIIEVEDTDKLVYSLDHYDEIVKNLKNTYSGNNRKFCTELENIVNNLFD